MGRDTVDVGITPPNVYTDYKDAVYAAHATGTIEGLLNGVIAANDALVQRIAPDEANEENTYALPPLVQTLVEMNIAATDISVMDKYQEHKHNVFKATVSGDKDQIVAKAAEADVTLWLKFAQSSKERAGKRKILPTELFDDEKKAHPLIQRNGLEYDFLAAYFDMTVNSAKYADMDTKYASWISDIINNKGKRKSAVEQEENYLKTIGVNYPQYA